MFPFKTVKHCNSFFLGGRQWKRRQDVANGQERSCKFVHTETRTLNKHVCPHRRIHRTHFSRWVPPTFGRRLWALWMSRIKISDVNYGLILIGGIRSNVLCTDKICQVVRNTKVSAGSLQHKHMTWKVAQRNWVA